MPVYNTARFIGRAIDSVLSQTFSDFEFLIIDDASKDGTSAVVQQFQDQRIRLIHNESNLGVAQTLNKGLDLAKGNYIARMDADDVCLPHRLERQHDFMQDNPRIAVVGSWVRFTGRYLGSVGRRPCGAGVVRAALCLGNPLFHPVVMIRSSVLKDNNLKYDPTFSRCEDLDLWSRLSEFGAIDNIPEILLKYHIHGDSVTAMARSTMDDQSLVILKRELARFSMDPSSDDLRFHRDIGQAKRLQLRTDLDNAETWLAGLVKQNAVSGFHRDNDMKVAASFAWFRLCANCGNLGFWAWHKYKSSPFAKAGYEPSSDELLRFLAGIVINSLFPSA
jgi:glycosyltransferase involved in cell wall biosynthesis